MSVTTEAAQFDQPEGQRLLADPVPLREATYRRLVGGIDGTFCKIP